MSSPFRHSSLLAVSLAVAVLAGAAHAQPGAAGKPSPAKGAAAAPVGTRTGADSLAVLNGMPIQTAAFEAYLKNVLRVRPEEVATLDAKRAYLRRFAADWNLAEKATKAGYDPMIAEESYKDKVETLYDHFMNIVIAGRVVVDEKEVERRLSPIEDERHVEVITTADKETADEVVAKLAAGADFAELAKQYSTGLSAFKGGSIGVVSGSDTRFSTEQIRAIFALKEGAVTPPMEHQRGFLIARLVRLVPAETLRAKAREEIRAQVRAEQFVAEQKKAVAEARAKATIWVDEKYFETGEKDPMTTYVAKVNGKTISSLEADANPGMPHTYNVHSAKVNRDLLDKQIDQIVMTDEAERQGYLKDPAVVARLTAHRVRALASAYLKRSVQQFENIPVSEKEISEYYAKNYEPMLYETSLIVVPTKEEALAIRKELAAGGDFAAIAKRSSKDPSAKKGGGTGFYPIGKMRPEFGAAVKGMKKGDTSDPIKTDDGWAIVRVTEKMEVKVPALEALRQKIVSTIMLQKRSDQLQKTAEKEGKDLKLTVDEKKLAAWTYRW